MDSINVAVPGAVSRLAADVASDVAAIGAARGHPDVRVRDTHTLVVKRVPDGDDHRLRARAREALAGTPAFEARVTRVDAFETAASGPSPVVYLAVEAPELRRLHHRLCDAFDPVADIEGEAYVPHVTVARGGAPAATERVTGPVEPIEWTVSDLLLYDATRNQQAGRVSLPA